MAGDVQRLSYLAEHTDPLTYPLVHVAGSPRASQGSVVHSESRPRHGLGWENQRENKGELKEHREPEAGSREPGAGREPGARSREPGKPKENQEPGKKAITSFLKHF